jgi:hypothetical protein
MKLNQNSLMLLALGLVLGWCSAPLANAQTTPPTLYHVTIDTSLLAGHPAGPFFLQFTLTDGSGTGDANSTVIVTNFNFGLDGQESGEPDTLGGVSGDMSLGVTLTDSAADNEFVEGFLPGVILTFDVLASLSLDQGTNSDLFDIALLDNLEERVPTLDTNSENILVRLTTSDGGSINLENYTTDPSLDPQAGGPPLGLGALVLLDGTTAPAGTPTLTLTPNSDGTATLAWPAVYGAYLLEQTTDFITWTYSPLEAVTVGANATVVISPNDPDEPSLQFYRLTQ